MRMSQLFGRTLRQAPADAEAPSHQLLVRGGFVRPLAAGLYSYLPLGWRVIRKVEAILRDEMERIGGQEVRMPLVNPADLWRESGRYDSVGSELLRLTDRADRELVLAVTHEEAATDLARRELRSHRYLPAVVYQFQTKVRDEPSPRGGLLRLREFLMKDAYSYHGDSADLDAFYRRIHAAYRSAFRRVGLEALPIEADPGMMGGGGAHEFALPSPSGEDTLLRCPACGYAANLEAAVAAKGAPWAPDAGAGTPRLVETPGARTIAALAELFGRPAAAFLKSVFYACPTVPPGGGERGAALSQAPLIVVAAIRGDLDVSEVKLARLVGGPIRLATDDELRSAGIPAGFASPVGLAGPRVRVVVDDSVTGGAYVAGANQPEHHLADVVFGRDFSGEVADIAVAAAGQACVRCGDTLEAVRAIELGHALKLGTRYSARLGATYLDADGVSHPIWMGSYGIGLDRLLAAVVEAHHDDKGILWPTSVAPYQVYLCAFGVDSPEVRAAAEALEEELTLRGVEVLCDDRPEPPGVKFNDADLIGLPVRVVVSGRSLKTGSAEVKRRAEREVAIVPLAEAADRVLERLG